jgi:hypothetical protein
MSSVRSRLGGLSCRVRTGPPHAPASESQHYFTPTALAQLRTALTALTLLNLKKGAPPFALLSIRGCQCCSAAEGASR